MACRWSTQSRWSPRRRGRSSRTTSFADGRERGQGVVDSDLWYMPLDEEATMAIKGAIPMAHGDVFPHGCFVVGEVQAMRDFDRSTKDQAVQAVDRETGELLWTVDVIDADPEARERAIRVRVLAPVQPVPPEAMSGAPFRPVEFDGLTATPYVAATATGRSRLAWSFRAKGMRAPGRVAAGAGISKAG